MPLCLGLFSLRTGAGARFALLAVGQIYFWCLVLFQGVFHVGNLHNLAKVIAIICWLENIPGHSTANKVTGTQDTQIFKDLVICLSVTSALHF